MISEWFVSFGMWVADWFVGLFPEWDVPAAIVGFDDTLNAFTANVGGLGSFVAWPLVIPLVAVSIGAWLIGFLMKSIRALASHIPLFGGSG